MDYRGTKSYRSHAFVIQRQSIPKKSASPNDVLCNSPHSTSKSQITIFPEDPRSTTERMIQQAPALELFHSK